MRRNYFKDVIKREDMHPKPLEQLKIWLEEAQKSGEIEANAMILATATPTGRPSARTVLLKELSETRLSFFSNYQSRKGQEMAENPQVALVFNWLVLERQVRVEGVVEKLTAQASEAYFHERPRGSQLGAWASPQSEVIPNREFLAARLRAFEEKFPAEIPRPEYWGGYALKPERVEFWQGGQDRLHDRFLYVLENDRWRLERLAP